MVLPSLVYARAPGRIDLAGGGTDPEPYASDFGGLVLNAAISCHTHVTVRARADRRVRLKALDLGREIDCEAGAKLPIDGRLDLPAALANRFELDRGCDIETWTELPPASGVSSSASLGVAAIAALARFTGKDISRARIAHLHSEVERFDLKIWGGKQDPFSCAHGGLRFWRFEGEDVVEEAIQAPLWALAELERDLLLVDSGDAHLSGDIHNDILADYRSGGSQVKAAQHRLKEVARLAVEALGTGNLKRFAELLDMNWEAHQRLHPSCSTPRLLELIALGKARGAWGAKVSGAGGGGCIVFLTPPDCRREVSQALAAAGARILPLKFDRRGLEVWERT